MKSTFQSKSREPTARKPDMALFMTACGSMACGKILHDISSKSKAHFTTCIMHELLFKIIGRLSRTCILKYTALMTLSTEKVSIPSS